MVRSAITEQHVQQFLLFFEDARWENEHAAFEVCDTELAQRNHLPPWHFWTLICLSRHHTRQNWVADVVKYQLQGHPDTISAAGAFGHPEIPQKGLVPKDNQWEYYFHGIGCCLTHRGSGESIDVDFYDETGDYMSLWFYTTFLKSLKSPEFPEKRLIELHPSFDSLEIATSDLFKSSFFVKHSDRAVFKLSRQVVSCLPAIESFCSQIAKFKNILPLAIESGDWLLAKQLLAPNSLNSASKSQIEKLAVKSIETRLHCSQLLFENSSKRRVALTAIDDCSPQEIDKYILKTLKGLPNGAVSHALELIHRSNAPKWCPHVWELFESISPNSDIPEPYIWKTCAAFLLAHDYQSTSVVAKFDLVESRASADTALLALQYAPDRAVGLFRKALRSSIPHERIESSAMLAIIDQPWSRRELVSVLSESDDQQMTLYARGALWTGKHPEDHTIVEAWELAHPRESETGEFITFEESSVRTKDSRMEYEVQRLHDQVWPLRNSKIE